MINFSKAKKTGYRGQLREWSIYLNHNDKKVGSIKKDFSDREFRHPKYAVYFRGQPIHEGMYHYDGFLFTTKDYYPTLSEAKKCAKALFENKGFLLYILTAQRIKLIEKEVNRVYHATN